MTNSEILTDVKNGLGITGTYQDNTLLVYIKEIKSFAIESGVKPENVPSGLITRGVADLWNYGDNNGTLSTYFMQRLTQLAYK